MVGKTILKVSFRAVSAPLFLCPVLTFCAPQKLNIGGDERGVGVHRMNDARRMKIRFKKFKFPIISVRYKNSTKMKIYFISCPLCIDVCFLCLCMCV
jgi:hypothetical protein